MPKITPGLSAQVSGMEYAVNTVQVPFAHPHPVGLAVWVNPISGAIVLRSLEQTLAQVSAQGMRQGQITDYKDGIATVRYV